MEGLVQVTSSCPTQGSQIIFIEIIVDIDECLQAALSGVNLCSDQLICSNTNGHYACLCPTGTELAGGVCQESKM